MIVYDAEDGWRVAGGEEKVGFSFCNKMNKFHVLVTISSSSFHRILPYQMSRFSWNSAKLAALRSSPVMIDLVSLMISMVSS